VIFAFESLDAALFRVFAPIGIMCGVALVLMIVAALIAASVKKSQMEWRYRMMQENPEAYKAAREWEMQQEQKMKEGVEKQKETYSKAAGVAASGAATVLKMFLKK
jgi:hypothetical protein